MTEARPGSVQLFTTCLVENLRPQVGLAVLDLLEGQGCAVSCPMGQTCCGQPAYNAGCLDDARAMARRTLSVLARSKDPVVIPSGSCADMIIHRYPEILKNDPIDAGAARELAGRTYELAQFLVGVLKVKEVGARSAGRITYHASCHLLRGLGEADSPLQLLATLSGAEMVPLKGAEECCGFGGLFAIKMSDISGAMLQRKLDHIRASDAQTVVACDTGCLLHLEGGLRRQGSAIRVLHLAEALVGT